MNVLGIETSCDETAAAVVSEGRQLRSSAVASQMSIHRAFRGIVPELASRAHVERINAVIDEALQRARCPIDAVAVTMGPGLVGSLLVGVVTARMWAWTRGIPVIGVNHLEGHLFAGLVEHRQLKPPFLGLIVSGGHTELLIFRAYGSYQRLGGTRDDAAGEAFDKVANLLGLPFPGGPAIDRAARQGNARAVAFPRAWLPGTWDFSFSGIKTAVANYLQKTRKRPPVADLAASFQEAVVEVLVKKSLRAAQLERLQSLVVGGGVAANTRLREALIQASRSTDVQVYLPERAFCTDNAAMIAAAGYYKWRAQRIRRRPRQSPIVVDANLAVASWTGR